VDFGMRRRGVQQEKPLAEADFEFDGMSIAEDVCPVAARRRGVGRRRGGQRQEQGLKGLQRQAGGASHAQDSSAGTGWPWREGGMPITSPWNTMVVPTKPCTVKMRWRRLRRTA